jgi:hypothetical protein
LFDGGIDGCDLPAMLTERKIRKLRVVACTNPCRERIGGILDLLETGYPITEYWFPQDIRDLCDAAGRFNRDWHAWQQAVTDKNQLTPSPSSPIYNDYKPGCFNWLESAAMLMELALSACDKNSSGLKSFLANTGTEARFSALLNTLTTRAAERWSETPPSQALMTAIARQYIGGGDVQALARLCGRLLLEEADLLPGGEERGTKALVTTLSLTSMTAALLAGTTAKIRFLKTSCTQADHLIANHPVKCLNGVPSAPMNDEKQTTTPEHILMVATRFSGHRRSLVYQYGNANGSALICGDSKFTFMGRGRRFTLNCPTVVLAPRQGGPSAECAYPHIHSLKPQKDIWVRSHYSYARKISNYFKMKKGKVCLCNCRDYTLQEIMLRHNGTTWDRLAGGTCVCE